MSNKAFATILVFAAVITGMGYLFRTPEAKAQAPNLQTTTPLAISAVGAAQSNAAILPAATGKMTFITGFDVTGGGATGASVVEVSITGLPTAVGTLKYEMAVLAGAGAPVNAQGGLFIRFPTPIPASAVNTAITVTLPTLGAGNTNASVTAYGFQF